MNNLLALDARNAIAAPWSMPAAVVVDLKSLLVDSVADLTRAINELLISEQLPALEEVHVRGMAGRGTRNFVRKAYLAQSVALDVASLDCRVEAMVEIFQRHLTPSTALRPGVSETMDALLDSGARLALVSDEPQEIADAIVGHLGLADSVVIVVGHSGGHPACGSLEDQTFAALDKLGIAREDAVMVGDSSVDTGAAHAVQIRSATVPFGRFVGLDAGAMAPAVVALFAER